MMARLAQLAIRVYQKTVSPDHGPLSRWWGPVCRYYPTCSEYGFQSFGKHGFFKGGWLTLKRVFRCVPWKPGGHDPVP